MNPEFSDQPDDIRHEQAALYALDALPADEAAKFRELARQDANLARLVEEYEAAGALLGENTPPVTPPPELRARILAAVASPAASAPSTASAAGNWIPWGVAAALALTAGALWMRNDRLDDRVRALDGETRALAELRREFDVLRAEDAVKDRVAVDLRSRITELERRNALAETQVATLTSKLDASYLASIAWDNNAQEGILKVRRLPAAERGKDYQLWVIDPTNAAPVSAGVFTVQTDGSATIRFAPTQKVTSATAFAVSLENAGGASAPAGPIVLSN